jgi:hypothetical protein
MNEYDATEQAFKNGYKKGVEDLAYRLKCIPRTSVYKGEIDQVVEELRCEK